MKFNNATKLISSLNKMRVQSKDDNLKADIDILRMLVKQINKNPTVTIHDDKLCKFFPMDVRG